MLFWEGANDKRKTGNDEKGTEKKKDSEKEGARKEKVRENKEGERKEEQNINEKKRDTSSNVSSVDLFFKLSNPIDPTSPTESSTELGPEGLELGVLRELGVLDGIVGPVWFVVPCCVEFASEKLKKKRKKKNKENKLQELDSKETNKKRKTGFKFLSTK